MLQKQFAIARVLLSYDPNSVSQEKGRLLTNLTPDIVKFLLAGARGFSRKGFPR
jgi:hypothetical protein